MARSIGLVAAEHIAAGAVEDHRLIGEVRRFGADSEDNDQGGGDVLRGMPAEELVQKLAAEAHALAAGSALEAVGIAVPGIVRSGVVEESPNLPQLKGLEIEAGMREALAQYGYRPRVTVSNDADVVAAGIAATRGGLDRLVRVWTLGVGIGFGHYPLAEGIWEGGHTVVSLDPNENFCGCGGRGHLEGIMGRRAMRLRFLDREPEEVFAAARGGPGASPDPRCAEFVILWHRALAAATATSIHLEGAGRFYITGMNARFVNLDFLNRCVQEMVKLSPLQSFVFEVVPHSDEIAVIGAAVNALPAEARAPVAEPR
ncbi:MAG TPA: ROK family protein [Bryobacteraceae bacterium]|nr:ROK family protein [Bryobacteraceae bacterium]